MANIVTEAITALSRVVYEVDLTDEDRNELFVTIGLLVEYEEREPVA